MCHEKWNFCGYGNQSSLTPRIFRASAEIRKGTSKQSAHSRFRSQVNKVVEIVFAVPGPIKPEAAGVVAMLSRMHIECTIMTGDNIETAKAIASECGIQNVYARMSPKDKAEKISK